MVHLCFGSIGSKRIGRLEDQLEEEREKQQLQKLNSKLAQLKDKDDSPAKSKQKESKKEKKLESKPALPAKAMGGKPGSFVSDKSIVLPSKGRVLEQQAQKEREIHERKEKEVRDLFF